MVKNNGIIICLISTVALLLAQVILCASLPDAATIPTEMPGIDYKDGLLSVSVSNKNFQQVMEVVSYKAGIEIIMPMSESAAGELTVNFENLPVEKGLKKLLKGKNYVFLYTHSDESSGSSYVHKIILFSESKGETAAGAVPVTRKLQTFQAERVAENEEERREKIHNALEKLKQTRLSKESTQKLSELMGPDFDEETLLKEIYKAVKELEGRKNGKER